MLITKIEFIKKELYRVDIDYEFAFALYERELKQFHLKENLELSEELVEEIEKEIVLPRAKRKAMLLLKYSDRTKEELRKRLLEASFHSNIVEKAIEYVEAYGYINDQCYMENYILFKKTSKSKKQIEMELIKKGMERQQVTQYLEENQWDEIEVLREAVRKRLMGKRLQEEKDLQKQYGYFMRKGYSYYQVKKVIEEYLEELETEQNL